MHYSSLLTVAGLTALAAARTDYDGCVSSQVVVHGGASMLWYVPESGEICETLDCGGGRAPPKYSVPGCPLYTGTAEYSPKYLEGYGPGKTPPKTTAEEEKPQETAPPVTSMTTEHEPAEPTATETESEQSYETEEHVSSSTTEESSSEATVESSATTSTTTHYTTAASASAGATTLISVGSNSTVTGSSPTGTAFEGAAQPLALSKAGREILGLAVGVVAGVVMF